MYETEHQRELIRLAQAIGTAASRATPGRRQVRVDGPDKPPPWGEDSPGVQISVDFGTEGQPNGPGVMMSDHEEAAVDAALIAAADQEHWFSLATLLRATAERHRPLRRAPFCDLCGEQYPCVDTVLMLALSRPVGDYIAGFPPEQPEQPERPDDPWPAWRRTAQAARGRALMLTDAAYRMFVETADAMVTELGEHRRQLREALWQMWWVQRRYGPAHPEYDGQLRSAMTEARGALMATKRPGERPDPTD